MTHCHKHFRALDRAMSLEVQPFVAFQAPLTTGKLVMHWDIPGYHSVQSGLANRYIVIKNRSTSTYNEVLSMHHYKIATICCISGVIHKRSTTQQYIIFQDIEGVCHHG